MFGFHNVFGKKKPNSDQDRQSSDGNGADRSPNDNDFVIIGSTASDRTAVKDTDVNPGDAPPPFHMFNTLYPSLSGSSGAAHKGESDGVNIMSLQGVPFVLNATLNIPGKLEQIWQRITPCLNSIVYPKSLESEYDFNVERSVVS